MRTRSQENALRLGAFVTLFGVLFSHALLETARDALFLANLPAERLPWVYLIIAGLALGLAMTRGSRTANSSHRVRLIATQLAAVCGTLGFWWLIPGDTSLVYYALYVWSGLISSLLVVAFWLTLGDFFTITQGKRLYASIATGGALGALAGFGLAAVVARYFDPDLLLLISACGFGLSALAPAFLLRAPAEPSDRLQLREPRGHQDSDPLKMLECIADVKSHAYARRVGLLVILATLTVTATDFLFKSVLSDAVPAEQLATWFASIYLALNAGSLLMLLFVVTPLIRRLSVHRALVILPGLMAAGAALLVLGGTLLPILMLKAADGTLRFSLQKTATELLYLPMPPHLRSSVKSFIDIMGQHGSKAIASVAILLLVPLESHILWIGIGVLLLALAWGHVAFHIRESYLDIFRRSLSEGSIETRIEIPELDLASLETLIRALSHPEDRHVLAALDLLVAKHRVDLIPSLILYHPSTVVVSRALDLFATAGRRDFLMLTDRMLEHEDPEVRAATVRALWATEPSREQLEALVDSNCACVKISSITGLMVHGWLDRETAEAGLRAALDYPSPEPRMALAHAIKLHHLEAFRGPLLALCRDSDAAVRSEAVRAIRASGDAYYTSHLISLLNDRTIREEIRRALQERGDDSLECLEQALADADTPLSVLLHIPRTISHFGNKRASEILLRYLNETPSGMVRYKILRGLGSLLTASTTQEVDLTPVREAVEHTLSRTLRLLHWQACLQQGFAEDSSRETCGSRLLLELLADKERLAVQRIFRLLYLLHPEENFRRIWLGLQSLSPSSRASSLELLDNLLPPNVGRAVLALVDRASPRERLISARSELAQQNLEYAALLGELIDDASTGLCGLAMYHVAELGLALPSQVVPTIDPAREGALARLHAHALALLERLPEAESTSAARDVGEELAANA